MDILRIIIQKKKHKRKKVVINHQKSFDIIFYFPFSLSRITVFPFNLFSVSLCHQLPACPPCLIHLVHWLTVKFNKDINWLSEPVLHLGPKSEPLIAALVEIMYEKLVLVWLCQKKKVGLKKHNNYRKTKLVLQVVSQNFGVTYEVYTNDTNKKERIRVASAHLLDIM